MSEISRSTGAHTVFLIQMAMLAAGIAILLQTVDLKAEPGGVATLPEWLSMLMTTGLFPIAFLAIFFNLILPAHDH